MKKAISVLLVCIMMLLVCACDTTVDTPIVSEKHQEAVIQQQEEPREMTLITSFGPELGAEIEIVLGDCFQVLSCRALNETGETLLEGIRLTDRLHYLLMQDVLKRAQELEWLEYGTKITVCADSKNSNIWTVATKDFLSKPFERYKEETSALYTYTVELPQYAPKPLNLDQYEARKSRNADCDIINYVDASNNPVKDVFTYEDGSTLEQFYLSGNPAKPYEILELNINAAGVSVSHVKETDRSGRNEAYYSVSMTRMFSESKEGYMEHLSRTEASMQDYSVADLYLRSVDLLTGSIWEHLYDDNGAPQKTTTSYVDGSYSEIIYENGNIVKTIECNADGSFAESTYDELGQPLTRTGKDAAGYLEECCYEDGKEKTYRRYLEDGSYELFEQWEWLTEKSGIIHGTEKSAGIIEEYDTEFTTE